MTTNDDNIAAIGVKQRVGGRTHRYKLHFFVRFCLVYYFRFRLFSRRSHSFAQNRTLFSWLLLPFLSVCD